MSSENISGSLLSSTGFSHLNRKNNVSMFKHSPSCIFFFLKYFVFLVHCCKNHSQGPKLTQFLQTTNQVHTIAPVLLCCVSSWQWCGQLSTANSILVIMMLIFNCQNETLQLTEYWLYYCNLDEQQYLGVLLIQKRSKTHHSLTTSTVTLSWCLLVFKVNLTTSHVTQYVLQTEQKYHNHHITSMTLPVFVFNASLRQPPCH